MIAKISDNQPMITAKHSHLAEARTEKKRLRQVFLQKRKLVLESCPNLQTHLCEAIEKWLLQQEVSCVGFYRPFRSEPDITPALESWAGKKKGRTLCVPVIDDQKNHCMHYALWRSNAASRAGCFGIEEPAEDIAVVPEVVFSPCVGVTRSGFRLGNGGGYFDRYLAQRAAEGRSPAATVAVAFEALVIEKFEASGCDVAFDWVATEAGVVPACGGAPAALNDADALDGAELGNVAVFSVAKNFDAG